MNNHLVLIDLVDNRIHNLKGGIKSATYCIENNMNPEYHKPIVEQQKIQLAILEKQRQIIFDNYLKFDVTL